MVHQHAEGTLKRNLLPEADTVRTKTTFAVTNTFWAVPRFLHLYVFLLYFI